MGSKRSLNTTINRSRNEKNDEHYTQLADIEDEVKRYRPQFKGKTVLCNCDDPRSSNFFKYFTRQFEILGLKRVIATCYKSHDIDFFSQKSCEKAVYQIYDGDINGNKEVDDEEIAVKELEGDGSFDSPECLRLLDEADIVVTNPPFSRFLDFLPLLINRGKKFLILGNNFHAKAKEIFPYFMTNQLWLGYNYGNMNFTVPDHYKLEGNRAWVDENGQKWHSLGNIVWYTNLEVTKRHEQLTLYKKYDPALYPKYDNYDAIHCKQYMDIPCDYPGVMGVPITYLCHHNPDQFELVGTSTNDMPKGAPYLHGKRMFERLLIRRKQETEQ